MDKIREQGGGPVYYPCPDPKAEETVLILPGGGYDFIAEREGKPVAEAFNRAGYHAVVFKYDVSYAKDVLGYGPLKEAAAFIRNLRKDETWKDKAQKIWLAGFSAGGHLAASVGVHWNSDRLFSREEQREQRPDGLILGYPVISMEEFGHPRSIQNLTGGDPELRAFFSLEQRDLSQVPPVFLWNTLKDEKVPALNSISFARKLALDGASVEYHLFHEGLHGLSLATPEVEEKENGLYADEHIAHWFGLCLEWMRKRRSDTADYSN